MRKFVDLQRWPFSLIISLGLVTIAIIAYAAFSGATTAASLYCLNVDSFRDRYLKLLEMAVTGSLHDEAGTCAGTNCASFAPYNPVDRERGNDWPPFGHTMVGHLRLRNIRMALTLVAENNIPGDFAELGVWRGGAAIYAAAVLSALGQDGRNVHIFDAFESLLGIYGASSEYIAVTEEEVKHNFQKYGYLASNVVFHKGLFDDTVPVFANETSRQLAVLRIDGNVYESYRVPLYYLYNLVPVGGFVIFDDVLSHAGAMKAWTDFKSEQGLEEELTKIDDHSAWFQKLNKVEVDWQFYNKTSPPV